MRLFIAINFNDETMATLLSLRGEMMETSAGGSFSPPENMHLTLVFLGECDEKRAAAAKAAMSSVRFEPFDVAIDRIGRFRRDDGDIWWAGLRESGPLLELQRGLSDKLSEAGFKLESRRYSPHITIGRKVVTERKPHPIDAFGETVRSVDLMKSERVNGRMLYTAIHTVE